MTEASETVPSAIKKLIKLLDGYFTNESRTKGQRFKPSDQDVIISCAAKSGTTWMQQICHGLRSGGDMNFDEISLVVPCLEMAHDYGYTDLQAPQPYSPRMYKTHFWYRDTPKGAGKYIVVVRKPEDAALSLYHFFENWFFRAGEISPDVFIKWIYLNRGAPEDFLENASQIHHIVSWYPHRLDDNVLWLHYEDLKADTRKCVRLVADFLDIGKGDETLQELVTHQAGLEFMKKHPTKFDEHPLKLSRARSTDVPMETVIGQHTGKLREGTVDGAKNVFSAETLESIRRKWSTVAEAEIGFGSYDALRASVNRELGRVF